MPETTGPSAGRESCRQLVAEVLPDELPFFDVLWETYAASPAFGSGRFEPVPFAATVPGAGLSLYSSVVMPFFGQILAEAAASGRADEAAVAALVEDRVRVLRIPESLRVALIRNVPPLIVGDLVQSAPSALPGTRSVVQSPDGEWSRYLNGTFKGFLSEATARKEAASRAGIDLLFDPFENEVYLKGRSLGLADGHAKRQREVLVALLCRRGGVPWGELEPERQEDCKAATAKVAKNPRRSLAGVIKDRQLDRFHGHILQLRKRLAHVGRGCKSKDGEPPRKWIQVERLDDARLRFDLETSAFIRR